MTHLHKLTPFSSKNSVLNNTLYSVQACASCNGTRLILQFKVNDPHHQINWQEQQQLEQRDYLWENTCFEAFISTPNHSEYFELNLSPSLAWNLYHFSDYRTPNGMPPRRVLEPALLKFEIEDRLITAEIDLTALKLADQEIKLGLSAVIKTSDSIEYLALHHPKPTADFHDQAGWTIRLLPDNQK